MATYKVIQDVEAEDHLIGNLSFRQFVYALIAVFMLYISYLAYSKHVAFILILTLPIMLFTGFLAFPFGKDQPTEVWALAKLRFIIKPRRRIWAQSGVKELVTITVPKKIEINRTDGLSQTEVKSRLQALANTIDSRGWAVKNISNIYQSPLTDTDSDRLISVGSLPQAVPDYGVSDADDVLDVQTNPIAQQMNQLMIASDNHHRQQLMQQLDQNPVGQTPGVVQSQITTENIISSQPTTTASNIITPGPLVDPTLPGVSVFGSLANPMGLPVAADESDESGLLNELKDLHQSNHSSLNNMRTLRPKDNKKTDQYQSTVLGAPAADDQSSTKAQDPVIMNLATSNDLNVTAIAHEANKAKEPKASTSDGEVLISLH